MTHGSISAFQAEFKMSRDYDIEVAAWKRFWNLRVGERIDAMTCSVMSLTLDRIAERLRAFELDVLTIDQAAQFVGVDAKRLGELSIDNAMLRPVEAAGQQPMWPRAALQQFVDELPAMPQ